MNEEEIISLFYAKSHSETYEVLFPLAQRGNKFATYFLGNMLISPIDQSVETDILGGVSYLKLSAKAGYLPALEFLGNLYAYNEKVKNDLVAAHTFFYLAALVDNKVDIGYHLLIEDEFGISQDNITKSKKLAEDCMAVGLANCELLNE